MAVLSQYYHSIRQGEGVADTLHNVVDFLKKNKKIWSLISEVMSLVKNKFILVTPATNASSDHAISALRRGEVLSPYNLVEHCLNHLMTCTVHKELVKELNLKQVTNDFVDRVERHASIFGTFPHSSYRCE